MREALVHSVCKRTLGMLGVLLLISFASLGCQARVQPAVLQANMPTDPSADDGVSFRALCYHDIRDRLRDTLREWPEATAVDTYDFIQHFSWLKEHGYHVVSLDAILAARSGGPRLPPRAVLLTFDDGYRSMYTRVFPLLKLFNYPAVLALVGEWLEDHADGKVFYGDRWLPREHFVTWEQVREMRASGLVEIASHSHRLHKGMLANAQGSQPPAAITRQYDAATQSYESDATYATRLYDDLLQNSAVIERYLGSTPRVMVWPYGAYTMPGVDAARLAGMPITMNLEPGPNTPDQPLSRIRRRLVYFHYSIGDLQQALSEPATLDGEEKPRQRVVQVSLDTLYDTDPARQEHNLGQLIERLYRLHVNTVYLQVFADLDGNGAADALYFPNRHLPMRADLCNRVAWQLRARAGVNVYAWLPVLAFDLPTAAQTPEAAYPMIQDIYEDLAKNTPVAGLVLPAAPAPGNVAMGQTAAAYRQHLSLDLVARFRVHQPAVLTVRMLDILSDSVPPDTVQIVQNVRDALHDYDFAALLAWPEATVPGPWLPQLLDKMHLTTDMLPRTVFLLQGSAPRTLLSSTHLATQLQWLQRHGARNFGYVADRFQNNHPAFEVMQPVMSLATNPGRQL